MSGTALADAAGVSRQVIVQDIALLRADGHDIVATNRGYVLREGASAPSVPTRLIKVHHTVEQLEDELQTIVDMGGTVQSVMVNHRAYGKIPPRTWTFGAALESSAIWRTFAPARARRS